MTSRAHTLLWSGAYFNCWPTVKELRPWIASFENTGILETSTFLRWPLICYVVFVCLCFGKNRGSMDPVHRPAPWTQSIFWWTRSMDCVHGGGPWNRGPCFVLSRILRNPQHCDCENETEFEFCSVKQNTVEEFAFECCRCVKKSTWSVAFLSLKPQLVQDLQYVISLLFHSLSMGNISKTTTNSRRSRSGSSQFHSVDRGILLNGLRRSQKDRRLERARSKNWSSSTWR